jgi:hypothetical protein
MKRLVAGLALFACTACSSGSTSTGSSTAPSTPPLAPSSDTFTGTVPVGGSDVHAFAVNLSNGQVTANLTAASSATTIAMGIGIGTFSSGVCTLIANGYVITPPGPIAQLSGNNFTNGMYCVAVFDVGNQTVDVAYSVTVTHY